MHTEFYELLFNTNDKKLSTIIDQDIVETPYDLFRRCEPLEQIFKDGLRASTMTTSNASRLGDYVENSIDWPLCSPRFATLLRELGPDVLEIVDGPNLVCLGGSEARATEVFNLLQCPPCIDLKKSNVAYASDGRIRGVYEIVISRHHAIPENLHIFRPKEWLAAILVSRALAQRLTKQKITGVAFAPVTLGES
jgi:hypothetical protein